MKGIFSLDLRELILWQTVDLSCFFSLPKGAESALCAFGARPCSGIFSNVDLTLEWAKDRSNDGIAYDLLSSVAGNH
jgi:hypothetical protein